MGTLLNPGFVRVGRSQFWNTQINTSYFGQFIKKFFSIYLLIKAFLSFYFIFIVSFKFIAIHVNKFFLLINFVKSCKLAFRFEKTTRRFISGRDYRRERAKEIRHKIINRKKVIKNSGLTGIFNRAFLKSEYSSAPNAPVVKFSEILNKETFTSIKKKKVNKKERKNIRRKTRTSLFILKLRQLLCTKLISGCTLKFRSVLQRTTFKKLVKYIYKKRFQKPNFIQKYSYYRDVVVIVSAAFFFQNSDLLATYVSVIVNRHRNLLKHLGSLRKVVSACYLDTFSSKLSLKIGVFGKIMGEKSRRFRRYIIFYGNFLSLRSLKHSLKYSLVQTFNIYGSFGIKVWLFYMHNQRKENF